MVVSSSSYKEIHDQIFNACCEVCVSSFLLLLLFVLTCLWQLYPIFETHLYQCHPQNIGLDNKTDKLSNEMKFNQIQNKRQL